MGAVVFLAGLAFAAVAVLLTLAVLAVLFKIVFKLILLPLLLLTWIVTGLVMMVLGPILFLAGMAAIFGMMLPLLPFVVLGVIVWLLVRSTRPAVAA